MAEPEEFVLENQGRAALMALSILGLILCSIFIALFLWRKILTVRGILAFAVLIAGVFTCGWSIFSLGSGKPYLETSPEGLMVGGFIRCYVPWSNIQGIGLDATMAEDFHLGSSAPKRKVQVVSIQLNDPDELYFDSSLHRILNRQLRRGVIKLNTKPISSMPPESICQVLTDRWERALGAEQNKTAGG